MSITKSSFIFHTIFLGIAVINFPYGKFLIGWDSIHPEFNFSLNFERVFSAVWSENYGLGAITGHGFASLLPHNIVTYLTSLMLPIDAIRPFFILLCLYLGGVGMFFLIKNLTKQKSYISLIASIFYMLNLGTVQMFYLPLEAYTVHFAALPWLFLYTIKLLQNWDKRNFFFFLIISIFSTTQGFIPSLFVVYFLGLSVFLITYVLLKKLSKESIKKSLGIIAITIIVNSYWLLPIVYYQINDYQTTLNAYNNLMSTEDFINKSLKYGDAKNAALLKGFYFDMFELKDYVFAPWINHQNNPIVNAIGYGSFTIILIGFLFGLLKSGNLFSKSLSVTSIYFFSCFAVNTPPFNIVNKLLYSISPVYEEAFRNSFTKFVLANSFIYSIMFAFGLIVLIRGLSAISKLKKYTLLLKVIILFSLIFYSIPIFKGNLFYQRLKLNIPEQYFKVMNYFKEKGDGRIADFPQDCSEGWYSYKWNYFGSGFYWYGIKQPILARAFDVWSNNNENYYWEISQALREKDYDKAGLVLNKYRVKWIILDKNLIHCRSSKGFMNYDEFINYLKNSPKFKLAKEFSDQNSQPIYIFENNSESSINFLRSIDGLKTTGPNYIWGSNDFVYQKSGDYESSGVTGKYYYPFRTLFTGRKQDELEFKVEENNESFIFSNKIPKSSTFSTPDYNSSELVFIEPETLSATAVQTPTINIENNYIQVKVPKVKGFYSAEIYPTNYFLETKNCSVPAVGKVKNTIVNKNYKDLLQLYALDTNNCSAAFELLNLPHNLSYLISIESKNIKGKSLLFWLENPNLRRSDMEISLPKNKLSILNSQLSINYFIIPPMEKDGLGYTLHFDNISIGDEISINELGKITVNQIPYNFLTNLVFVKDEGEIQPETYAINSTHPNPSLYEINFKDLKVGESTIVLSQSFHNGWNAYKINKNIPSFLAPLFGEKIKDHVLINNWENGWKVERGLLEKDSKIVIFFLPQYLQYLGFALLILVVPIHRIF